MLEHRRPAGIREGDVAEADRLRRHPRCRAAARRQGAARGHRRLEPQHGAHRRGRSVERPVQPAERDHRRADRSLREDDGLRERGGAARGVRGERPEDDDVRGEDYQQTPRDRLLAQPRRFVLQGVQPRPPRDEAIEDPVGEPEEPQLLGRRRVDGEPVGVLGVALRGAHRLRSRRAAARTRRRRACRRGPSR